jgi:hypothetical protein
LRDNSRGINISLEDFSVACKRLNTFLDAGTTRVIKSNKRSSNQSGFVHYLAYLFSKGFRKTTTENCEVLGERKYNLPMDCALSSDDTITIELLFFHVEIFASVSDELIVFHKRAFIE